MRKTKAIARYAIVIFSTKNPKACSLSTNSTEEKPCLPVWIAETNKNRLWLSRFQLDLPFLLVLSFICTVKIWHLYITEKHDYKRNSLFTCPELMMKFGGIVKLEIGTEYGKYPTLCISLCCNIKSPTDSIQKITLMLGYSSGFCGMIGGQAWRIL